jgi:hypothetical protein
MSEPVLTAVTLPDRLGVALKEWRVLVDALDDGSQVILLRKGGLVESAGAGGGFEVEHRAFWLYPTYLHQSAASLKPEWAARLEVRTDEPPTVTLSHLAIVTDAVRVRSREAALSLRPVTIWSDSLLAMRWDYKPAKPLTMMVVRVFRLPRPHELAVTPHYAGCKSWVDLAESPPSAGASPVLDDAAFAARRAEALAALAAS